MLVKQISVFLENREGRICEFADVLAKNDVNILTMSIADTTDYGILRCITSDNDKAIAALREHGFNAISTELIGFEVDHTPGEMRRVLKVLSEEHINIAYLYSYSRAADKKALILLKVEDNAAATEILERKGINTGVDSII